MRSYLRHNRSMVMVALGSILLATSVLWEYARMNPQFRYIVEPWSIRGYETTQGLIFVFIAVSVVTIAALTTTGIIKETTQFNLGVAAFVTAAAALIPIVADAKPITPGWPVTWGLALLAGLGVRVILSRFAPASLQGSLKTLALLGSFFVAFIVVGVTLHSAFGNKETAVWIVVLLAALFLDIMVLFREPAELSTYRTLINVTVAGWLMSMASAAAVRVTLQQAQFEEIGVAPEIDSLQVTSGMLIAWFAGLLMFIGTVALWAGRREQLAATHRALSQIEAARISAQELGEDELRVAAELEEVVGGEV